MKFIRHEITPVQFKAEGSTYTLIAKRSGYDRNGNPKYDVTMTEVTEIGLITLWELTRIVTSYNIRQYLEGVASDIIKNGFEQIY